MSPQDKPLEIGLVTVSGSGEAMLNFYRDVFGFERVAEIPFPGIGTVNRLHSGARTIKLLVLENAPEQAPVQGAFTATTGLRYVTLWVDDLAATVAACRERGCEVPVAPKPLRPGVDVAMVKDPDGNTLEVMAEV
ncbi:MAG TPA: VOC family protein [Spongiibacteraceae bacterium]|jgi:catechol 2,3-dioxygenase-like lactoylglutathione lyase family enzyme|nr:VOC family protein [Spongiibacteraceae bacterium]HUH37235.1 VOC family protein [Spongiibacteraceae bacterium]